MDRKAAATNRKDQPPGCSQEDLDARSTQIYLTRAEKVAFVQGDTDVDFQYVADVIEPERRFSASYPPLKLGRMDAALAYAVELAHEERLIPIRTK